ncbi:tRNA (adenosine(37)-N6)-threonylcarbamoyltransferase complex transferase subunit TsaD [archaeon]|jgi:N6-L-threonylcarbamoyladenine synthase|nr:tRNA (adenosine(37)-N6)-threonylcarbamoyltransferase complex transferase subunit TsaD [archaeon]MBT6182562.1 tRNA (adenosine(37)-N6)-threonylcarbamoyltransferase complex transferase subunit TsaD [archaeon]MBT6606466.1 tRNA (adenosine(37)-N6)-threonylcarbamoyltransferase complex transferase subunit TsaD [archaeon]MBT7251369.1 tRNA (adenosine(37)-N6)-threonylcarbamoyltransferase complex transferase subunit TsaD [archaeon]MBT7660836.1 tRNA (adenosine(37)-N6)-threonylcarbamoyltransferase complex
MTNKQKYLLAIESTAHTFGVAVLDFDKKILANITDSWVSESGGMIPIEVRKHHKIVSEKLYKQALEKANITEDKIEAVALSNAPGLAPCLLEGMEFAKKLATKLNVQIVGVNHCIAHLEIGETTGAKDPVLLYASGANTQVIAYEAQKYRIFGETLDLGIGNFIDTIARYFGLGFPGGPKIEKLAQECKNKKELIELAYSVKGMDVSFSGIQTQIKNLYDKKTPIEDLAYSLQETVFAMLTEVAERALAHTGKKELLLGGGVACNARLQEMCQIMCNERGVKFFCPPKPLLVDNAAMIGYLGLKMFKARLGESNLDKIDIKPRERTDEVQVNWK